MRTKFIIWIKQVNKGENEYWLHFDAYVDRFDKNKLYGIEYCGTEASSSIPLTSEQSMKFVEMLSEDFGYAPFNVEKARLIIGSGKEYIIDNQNLEDKQ